MSAPRRSTSLRLGRAVIGGLRLVRRMIPRRAQQYIEDRIFYGIFNVTRVMNDNYGWRPDPPVSYTPGNDPASER